MRRATLDIQQPINTNDIVLVSNMNVGPAWNVPTDNITTGFYYCSDNLPLYDV